MIGQTDFRHHQVRFGIKESDRRYHLAVIGRTGMGKSTLLANLINSDIQAGNGLALLDPHGDLAEEVLRLVPEERRTDLIYFNPSEPSGRLGLNILEPKYSKPHLVVSGVISIFKKIWSDSWGPRMEHLFRYALSTLVGVEGTTLADVPRIFLDKSFRAWVLEKVTDPVLQTFWTTEYERYTPSFRTEAISPILNKVGQFIVHPEIRGVIASQRSGFDLRRVMDEGKIFIANLSKGTLGEDGSALLGSLLSTRFELAALSRADQPQDKRRDFHLYVDELPAFATSSFSGMLSESRKYGLSLVLAMQYLEQIEEPVRNALFENVGTLVVFRVGPETARHLAPQFAPTFSREDLMNIGRYQIYVKLMIDGIPSTPFSARTLALDAPSQGGLGV